jgi:2-isopropylmalate synthase
MIAIPSQKYRPFPVLSMPNRQWPSRELTHAPIWCSVDLRDGNQALAVPMNVSQKLELFDALVKCGFKQIEVGFPSASDTEFAFMRQLIEGGRIPADVTIQVLVQAREDLIERTVESLIGAPSVIIHLYNSTSPAQREIVFGLEKKDIVKMAVRGAQWIKDRLPRLVGSRVQLQYSPESFSATEVEFSLEICEAVMEVWKPTAENKVILNLPDTVEVAMPNVYADQIEWFITHLKNREAVTISLHTHNDRGTGTAATELGLLAGADRVEGTLFGNGERTGNLDIINVAMNLYMHGIDPKLDFSNINALIGVYERCTGMTVPPRHPYAGELVFTAFSGSHQDAVKKGLQKRAELLPQSTGEVRWNVPYLTIDPEDLGRQYREVIRVNSQSGKGGVAYLLESDYGISLPKDLQREFGPLANTLVDRLGREVTAAELKDMFYQEYVDRTTPWTLESFADEGKGGTTRTMAEVKFKGESLLLKGEGNGPLAAFMHSLPPTQQAGLDITDYSQHSLGSGADAQAIAYVRLKNAAGKQAYGVGVHTSIELASINAVLSALNRLG